MLRSNASIDLMRNGSQRLAHPGNRWAARFLPVLVIAVCSLVAEPASARDPLRVPGSFPTIQAALDAAQAGDVILVAPGVYRENPIVRKTVTLASEFFTTGDPRVVDTTTLELGAALRIEATAGPSTRLIGFTMRGGAGHDGISVKTTAQILDNHLIGFSDGIDFEPPDPSVAECVCRNNTFDNPSDDGIDLDRASEGLIENNTIRNAGNDAIEIRFHPTPATLGITIRGNRLTGSREDGVQLIGYAGESHRNVLIERNTITSNGKAGVGLMDNEQSSEDFRAASLLDEIRLFNNTFVGNNHALSGGDNLVAVNNVFVNSAAIAVKGVDANSTVARSLFWNNGTDAIASNVDAATTLRADPRLAPDYTLMPGSPAIDAGVASFVWQGRTVLDLPAESYSGPAPDLGASEHIPLDQRPTVRITSPAAGGTVSGTVAVQATAGDDRGVTQVEFTRDGVRIGLDGDGADGWTAAWDTTAGSDGSHRLTAVATDTSGHTTTDSIDIWVDNVDDPPAVRVTSPARSSTVSGTVTVRADAGDDRGVAQVEFTSDGTSIGVDPDGADGWTTSWDTTTVPQGPHTLTATATDTSGQTTRDSIDVTVGQDTPPVVRITSPAPSGTVSGVVSVQANATDDQGITQVQFASDGVSIGLDRDGADGWSVSWDTTPVLDGPHRLTATATDTSGQTGTDAVDVRDVSPLYFSLKSAATLGDVAVADEDIAFFNGSAFSLYFDGSDVGIAALRIDAFARVDADTIVLSFDAAGAIPGVAGTVDDSDLVRFDAASLGSTTSGAFALYFDGSDVGLTTSDEDVDALEILPGGRILISTFGAVSVSGASGADEDLLAFTPASLGATTKGSFAFHLDGSDVGLGDSGEDIDGAAVDGSGRVYLSSAAAFAVPAVSGQDEDIFVFGPSALGSTTSGSYLPTLYFDGSTRGLAANNVSDVGLP